MTDNENKQRRIEDRLPDQPLDWSDAQYEQSSTAGAAKGGNTSEENGAAPVPPLTAPAPLTDLHNEIMNLQIPVDPKIPSDAGVMLAYKIGHRDARHAAAELAIVHEDAPAPLADDYRQIAHLIGSIFFAGDFKAETANERELEALLIKTGHRYASWDEIHFAGHAKAAPAAPAQTVEPYAYEQDNGSETELVYAQWFAMGYGKMDPECIYRPLYLAAPVQAEQAQAEPVAWMNPETLDVIHDTRKRAWESDFGMGGKAKAAGYTCQLVAPAQAEQAAAVRAAYDLADGLKKFVDLAISELFTGKEHKAIRSDLRSLAKNFNPKYWQVAKEAAIQAPRTGEAKGDAA